MSDVIGQVFEVSQHSGGAAAIGQWISSQVSQSNATHIIATLQYKQGVQQGYVVVLMATNLALNPSAAVANFAASAQFDIRNGGLTALLAWLNAQEAGVVAPAAPTLSSIAGGVLTSQGTRSVRVTLVTSHGETAASVASTLAIADDHELVVASPVEDAAGLATGWNVYIGPSGTEVLQNGNTPIAIGTSYTLTTVASTGTAAAPSTNATAAKYIRHFGLVERFEEKLVTVVVSN